MRGMLAVLVCIILAMICWGVYGPVLQIGREAMHSSLKPFICVGIAYFLIAVVAPGALLFSAGEKGQWTALGILWSLIAGAAGALGALGIILAFTFRGSPVYVMPLVFGCAPVINTFLTTYWSRSYRQIGPIFVAGLILVVVGAVTVLVFRPHPHPPAVTNAEAASPAPPQVAAEPAAVEARLTMREIGLVFLFTGMTALCWGVYGPTLHRGQSAMEGSRLRPFLCVGLSYFLIAVLVPAALLGLWTDPGEFNFAGTAWSLGGGAVGAIGALGIIMAFNFGGKPIYVMPLVFGGAPVVNTFVSLAFAKSFGELTAPFYAGLMLVVAGAVTVLLFAPKSTPHHAPPEQAPAEAEMDTPPPAAEAGGEPAAT